MSFAEWTATSIRSASSASSSSLTKTPRLPISPNGLLRSRSPAVVTGTRANSTPGCRSCSTASSACVSARRLPLDPILRTTSLLGDSRLLQTHDRLVQDLVDDLARQRLDRVPLALRKPAEPPARLRQLATPDLLGPLAKRRDRSRLCELGLATGKRLLDDGLEVVDVVHVTVRQLVDQRIDVAGNGKVDQEQRAPPALVDMLRRDDVVRGARGRNDDVRRGDGLTDSIKRDRRSSELRRNVLPSVFAPVGDEAQLRAALDQAASGERTDLPRPDDGDP